MSIVLLRRSALQDALFVAKLPDQGDLISVESVLDLQNADVTLKMMVLERCAESHVLTAHVP